MKTSEIRKLAFKLAVDIYENSGGDLLYTIWNLNEEGPKYGIIDPAILEGIEHYLSSVGVMEHIGIGDPSLKFTSHGISVLEQSLGEPDISHAPFPPLSVVIGNVSGSQISIGSGSTFNQTSSNQQGIDPVHLSNLVQAAFAAWDDHTKALAAGAAAAINTEAQSPKPDLGLIRSAAARLGSITVNVGQAVATQTLVAYLKAHGIET